ncbi:TetR/AcrR family transcriptional regulator [Saccharopolyspora sp. 5N708]|uniref:TetR/AcrR family transcriptional regulator n=1 Tax=Saccharopolyspora sp. 5N708 TaxID=3457424 RepID=UPI003FD346D3
MTDGAGRTRDTKRRAKQRTHGADAPPARGSAVTEPPGDATAPRAHVAQADKPRTGPKRQARTAQRREDVLRAALAVFGERGFRNASLTEIAERAGMTHAGVLHHFGSKDQLLLAVLRYRDGQEVAGVTGRSKPHGAELLPHLVQTVGENESQPGIVQAFTVLAAESATEGHPAQSYFRDRMAGLRAAIAAGLAERTGRDAADPEVIDSAAALIAVMDGLQIQWLLRPDAVSMPRSAKLVLDAVIAHLAD